MKKMFNFTIFLSLIFIVFVNISFSQSSSKRSFNKSEMFDGSLPKKGTWAKRLKKIDEILDKIKKKIDDPESDINTKLSDCISVAVKNLYDPIVNGWQYIPIDLRQLKIKLSKENCATDTSDQHALAETAKKFGLHPDVNQSTYHGNMYGEIRIYPRAFEPEHIKCLEPNLFHEILHLACFTKKKGKTKLEKWLGEKIAYACSYKVYKSNQLYKDCLRVKNPFDEDDEDYSDPDECTKENCEKEKKDRKDIDEQTPHYIFDTPDDNYSMADGAIKQNLMETDFLIYRNGSSIHMDNLIGGIYFKGIESPGSLLEVSNVMVFPSTSLAGTENDAILRETLREYVSNGGNIIIFTQQFGDQINKLNFSTGGESIKSYGYREDSSCLKNSVYLAESGMHAILSSTTSGILDVGIDGYATVSTGSNATVLLRRKVNAEPALLYYKYGNGTIYLFFGFTDFANSRSMASVQELKLVKNILRHAMAPDDYIPIFDLEENPNPAIGLNIKVCNHSETPAAKAKISVYTIENTPVYETEVPVSLNQEESAEIPITFTLPDLESKDYGIGFSVYELKDASGNLIQLKTETPTGRFSIYKLITPANIDGGFYRWITINDEIAFWGENIVCTMHFKNTTQQVQQVEINDPYFAVAHISKIINFSSFSASINPGETHEHTVSLSTTEFSQWDNSKITFRIMYYDSEGNYKQFGAGKVVYVKKALTKSTVQLNTPYALAPGGTLDYSLHSFSEASIAGESTVKLVLEKYIRENSAYAEIKTLYQGSHDFNTNGDFQHNATYTPETVFSSGPYRLKLDVTAPNGVKELTRYQEVYYERSGFKVSPGSIEPSMWLVPGESYTIPIYVKNISSNNDYHVTNGRCTLRVLSPGSHEIYRKEIAGIDIAQGSQLNLTESFVFNPVETGDYILEYAYEDETFSDNLRFRKAQVLYYWPSFSVTPDKPGYNYMDTSNIAVKVNGLGSYTIQCQCPEAGVEETRSVLIPDPGITATEVFQVPLGLSSYYHVNVRVTDASTKSFEKTIGLYVKPVQLDCSGEFKSPISAGFPLEFEVNLKRISGFSQPLTGELAVTSTQLNYQDIKTVTLQPIGDNRFVYAIPVDVETPSGFYRVDAQFNWHSSLP